MVEFYIMDISKIGSNGLYYDGIENVCNRALRYEDFVRSASSRQLLKYVLWREFKLNLNYDSLKRERWGKPILIDYPFISFNIAPSNNMVACVVGKGELGIDIEYIRQIECCQLAEHFFHINERKFIVNAKSGTDLDRFYKIWTLKESYIKCIGKGLNRELDSFFLDVKTDSKITVYDEKNSEQCAKYEFYNMRYKQYHISICSEREDINKEAKILDYNVVTNFLNSRAAMVWKDGAKND